MWAPMIYDNWESMNGKIHFSSFALITSDPPSEVLEQGHDRCPIFIKESNIDSWLKVNELDRQQAFNLLEQKERVEFLHSFK